MRDLTREDLLRMTPDRYLASGYMDQDGSPRAELRSEYATAASTQFLMSGLSPQELGLTIEGVRQLLPMCKGRPSDRAIAAAEQSLAVVEGMIHQPVNAGLAPWLRACAARVSTPAELDAFMGHLAAVRHQYGLIAGMQP